LVVSYREAGQPLVPPLDAEVMAQQAQRGGHSRRRAVKLAQRAPLRRTTVAARFTHAVLLLLTSSATPATAITASTIVNSTAAVFAVAAGALHQLVESGHKAPSLGQHQQALCALVEAGREQQRLLQSQCLQHATTFGVRHRLEGCLGPL
jgi:hypothetical protein